MLAHNSAYVAVFYDKPDGTEPAKDFLETLNAKNVRQDGSCY